MIGNRSGFTAFFLILIMITMSMGQSISNDRDVDNEGKEEINQIDYSYLENNFNEGYEPNFALSQTRDYAVLRVDFSDESATKTRVEVQNLFAEVRSFFDEATYGGTTVNFDVYPTGEDAYRPINRSNADGTGDSSPSKADYGNFKGCTNNDDIMSDTIIAAYDEGVRLAEYDGIVLVHSGGNNGCSSQPNNYGLIASDDLQDVDGDGDFEAFSQSSDVISVWDKSITWLGEYGRSSDNDVAVWGRWAHEIGHSVGLPHLAYDYAHCHDVMGSSCAYPVMPSSWTRALEGETWDSVDKGLQSMDAITDFTVVGPGMATYEITDVNDDPDALPAGFNDQVLKIPISGDGSLYYLVEARFETSFDVTKPIPSEGVMIYRVNEWAGYNPAEDLVWGDTDSGDAVSVMSPPSTVNLKYAAWSDGEIFEDLNYGLEIEVLSVDIVGHSAEVKVTYNPTGASPADIHISDWGQPPGEPGPWETIDIWVDSRLNNNDIDGDGDADWDGMNGTTYAQQYKWHVPADEELPTGRGDMPWVDQVNRFYVKISNNGETTLGNGMVKILFQWKKPTAGGELAGDWTTIGRIVCGDDAASISQQTGNGECLDFGDFPEESNVNNELKSNKPLVAYIEWTPESSDFPDDSHVDTSTNQTHKIHSCIRVVVEPVGDEPTLNNNDAQENLNYFETSPGSPYHPLMGSFTLNNPFDQDVKVILQTNGMPEGWTNNLSWYGGDLAAGQAMSVDWDLTPSVGYPLGMTETIDFSMIVFKDDIDKEYSDHGHMYKIGGTTNQVNTVDRVFVDTVATSQTPGVVTVYGDLDPYGSDGEIRYFNENSRISIILTSPDGTKYVSSSSINLHDGEFSTDISLSGMATDQVVAAGGLWDVQVYFGGDTYHRTAWGAIISVPVQPVIKELAPIDINLDSGGGNGISIGFGGDFIAAGTLPTLNSQDTSLEILYTSPSGEKFTNDVVVDKEGNYLDTFKMNESGNWRVDYSYKDGDGNLQSWNESVTVEKEKDELTPSIGLLASVATIMIAVAVVGRKRDRC